MSDQPNETRPDGKILATPERSERPRRSREPSVPEMAAQIATRLGIAEETTRIQKIVWNLGRTQALALCTEALEGVVQDNQAERFFALVETKGVKKQRLSYVKQPVGGRREHEVTHLLADQLGEHEPGPWQGLYRSVQVLGVEAALALLQQTHDTEAAGGLMLPDGSRRRTPGGVYFYLVRQTSSDEQRQQIFPPAIKRLKKHEQPSPSAQQPAPKQVSPSAQPATALIWAERAQLLDDTNQGEAKTVKMTLIGRPGKVVERGNCVAFVMQQAPKIPALPAGLPLPPLEQVEATRYNVYIALKQWRKVAEAIINPEDALIIEGFPILDAQRGTIAVFTSNVTTKLLQAASRSSKV